MRIRKRSSCASGKALVDNWSTGFCVAITKKGVGSARVAPSLDTCRSSIASSSADCVFGEARLISSASSSCVKIGPGWKTNSPLSLTNMAAPVRSPGSRSLVNCTRLNDRPSVLASAWASTVLPMPGRSSSSRWPRAIRPAMASLTAWLLPSRTLLTADSALSRAVLVSPERRLVGCCGAFMEDPSGGILGGRLVDVHLAHHAVPGMSGNAAFEFAAGGLDRHEPPFDGAAGVNLQFADAALDFAECLAVGAVDLRLAGENGAGQGGGCEIVGDRAGVAQDDLVQLAGFEIEFVRGKQHLALGVAELNADFHGVLAGQVAGGVGLDRYAGKSGGQVHQQGELGKTGF